MLRRGDAAAQVGRARLRDTARNRNFAAAQFVRLDFCTTGAAQQN